MPLKRVQRLNYSANYAYAPPHEDAVINTDEILSVVTTEDRGIGPFVCVKFRDGSSMTCVGTPTDFLPAEAAS